jgi:hypothetical protein
MAKFSSYIQLHKNMEDLQPMKCLKNVKTSNIIRVTDKQADQMIGREWQYTSKVEWKTATRVSEPTVEAVKEEPTLSEKQLKRKKK